MKYKYVYSLTDNGNVFYIGCATDLSIRYRQHIAPSNNKTECGKYIQKMISSGNMPEIHIISYLPMQDALKKEMDIIMSLSVLGHKLTNKQHCWDRHKDYPFNQFKDKKDLFKIIIFRMQKYCWTNVIKNADGKVLQDKFPYSPSLKKCSNE